MTRRGRPIEPGQFGRDVKALRRLRKRLVESGNLDWHQSMIKTVDHMISLLITNGAPSCNTANATQRDDS